MRGVNRVTILGTAGRDAETRYTGSGTAVTELSLATNESWTDKQSGEKQERTEWHRVVFFGRLAEIAGEYVTKGKQVYIEGQLRTEKYTDKEGIERYATKIYGNELQLLGGGGEGQSQERPAGRQNSQPQRGQQGNQGRQQQRAPAPAPAPSDPGLDEDLIPF